MSDSPYIKLAAINVNEHVEKKNNLSYLSWAWAVDQLLRQDHTANWTYDEPVTFGDGTMMVRCTVTAFGIARQCFLPVMDHRNKAIQKPDSFQVNTAMQRCLVKAIALHGLGLYIYAGEDLPEGAEAPATPTRPHGQIAAGDVKAEAWDRLSRTKGEHEFLKKIGADCMALLTEDRADDAYGLYRTNFDRMDTDEQLGLQHVMDGLLSKDQRKAMKEAKERYEMVAKVEARTADKAIRGATPQERQAAA